MKELSLNILDIAMNSVKAEATLIVIDIKETPVSLSIEISDDGFGMDELTLASVTNPFSTSRTTRKVGMGIPLFKLAAELTGGEFKISSRHKKSFPENHGTSTYASFFKNHIDFTPLGDVVSTVLTLIQGNPDIDFLFKHETPKGALYLDTREIREVLEDVPLDSFEVLEWIKENLKEQYSEIF